MSERVPQDYELAAFKFFKELQPDCEESDQQLFLDNYQKELAEMKAYLEANGCDERTAFEAIFCEPTSPDAAQKIPLPGLATYEELKANDHPDFLKGDGWFNVNIINDYLDFTKPYEPPKYTLSYNNIPFAPLGGIHALTGLSGNGKTMTFTQFMAAILAGSYGGLKYELSDRVPNPIILYVDTEQELDNTIAVKNRVCNLIGWNPQQARNDFRIVMLRETATAVERWQKTLKAIYEVRPTVIFIDGLLDVVNDFNSNEECQKLVYKCMQVATYYSASVWCLVHLNPNGAKLVGHLGSMLERKVTDLFSTSKDNSKGEAIFTVTQKKARGRDVPEWKFRVLPINGWGRPEQINSISSDDIDIEDIRKWLQEGQNDVEFPAYESSIKNIFKERGNVRSNDTLQECVTRAKNRRFLIEQPKEEWEAKQKHPKYYLSL